MAPGKATPSRKSSQQADLQIAQLAPEETPSSPQIRRYKGQKQPPRLPAKRPNEKSQYAEGSHSYADWANFEIPATGSTTPTPPDGFQPAKALAARSWHKDYAFAASQIKMAWLSKRRNRSALQTRARTLQRGSTVPAQARSALESCWRRLPGCYPRARAECASHRCVEAAEDS